MTYFCLDIEGSVASELLALDLSTSGAKDFAIDIRDSAVTWVNDLENDAQYKRWPSSVMDLMRPTFPGMLRNVRKNIFNLVTSRFTLVLLNRSKSDSYIGSLSGSDKTRCPWHR